jgi:hypothetical protein
MLFLRGKMSLDEAFVWGVIAGIFAGAGLVLVIMRIGGML